MTTINIEFPNGWSNCGVTISNHFIADTNNSEKWDTLKFPLPKPTYKWEIKCYNVTHSKSFVVLIDKN